MSNEKKFVGVIDLTPTWMSMLPVLLAAYADSDSSVARATAKAELERMAQVADAYVAMKKQVEHAPPASKKK